MVQHGDPAPRNVELDLVGKWEYWPEELLNNLILGKGRLIQTLIRAQQRQHLLLLF